MRIVVLSVILSCAALGAGSSGVVAPDDACSLVAEYAGFSRPSRGRSYAKDAWNVYYRGWKVDGASASSFEDLGGGYGKDDWTVFFRGDKVREASASSFECLGGGYGKDAWNVFYMGRKLEGVSPSAFRMPGRR